MNLRVLCMVAGMLASAAAAAADDRPAPVFGMWYTVWWTKDDQFRHWSNCHVMPVRGRYSAGDPKVIADHHAQLRDLGVDFVILDDTNCIWNDGGRIKENIQAWFDYMDARPPAERIPLCIGGGGEMREEGRAGQSRAAGFYYANWAKRPSYFLLNGKPLLLVDTDDNYGPGDWDDERFAVRWAYNGDNFESMGKRKTWGWGSYEPAPILAESMSIWPGHRFPKHVERLGHDPLEEPREGGQLYVRMWLRVLKARPRFVTVADFNNFEEETAIEASYAWEDPRGHAVPDLYLRITRAYSRLRTETPVLGEYYRDEERPEVYLFDGTRFVYQGAMPRRATVILTPAGMLERMRQRHAAPPTASQPGRPDTRRIP